MSNTITEGANEMSNTHDFRPGDFLSYSWGYDQTNVDFYRVTRTTEKSVWIQRVEGQRVASDGYGNDQVKPTSIPRREVKSIGGGYFWAPDGTRHTIPRRIISDEPVKPQRKTPRQGHRGEWILSMDCGIASKVDMDHTVRETSSGWGH